MKNARWGAKMTDKDDIIGDGIRGEEELLDFEFDELSESSSEKNTGSSTSDEEILDLVDIAGPGMAAGDLEADEIKGTPGEDEKFEEEAGIEEDPDLITALEDLESPDIDMFKSEEAGEVSESSEIASLLELGEDGDDQAGDEEEPGPGMEQFEGIPEEDASSIFDLDSALKELESPETDNAEPEEGVAEDSETDEIASLFEDEDIIDDREDMEEEPKLDLDELNQVSESEATEGLESELDSAFEELGLSDNDILEMEDDDDVATDDIIDFLSEEEDLDDLEAIEEEPDLGIEEIDQIVDEDSTQVVEPQLEAFVDERALSEDDSSKVEGLEKTEPDDIAMLLDEEEIFDEQEGLEEKAELGLDDLDQLSDEDMTQSLEPDFDGMVTGVKPTEDMASAVELKESDLVSAFGDTSMGVTSVKPEEISEVEKLGGALPEGDGLEEFGADISPELPSEDFSEVSKRPAQRLESDTGYPEEHEAGSISEERLEAIVTKVVEDVLEKVATETMEKVAEKVITKAIEALKGSLESSKF